MPVLARSAVALGIAAVFMETHQDPNAPSDGPDTVYLKDMPALLETLLALDKLAKIHPPFVCVTLCLIPQRDEASAVAALVLCAGSTLKIS